MRGRLSREEGTAKLGGLEMSNGELRSIERIILCGCGTAGHAAMVGEYVIEQLAHVLSPQNRSNPDLTAEFRPP